MSDALAIASRYKARGWNPVPIPYRKKKPVDDAWQTRDLTEATLPKYFNGALQNVGVQLGPRSNGLTDIDLDCHEAISLARYFLPKTDSIFGRAGKPRSHLLYYIDNAPEGASIKLTDVTPEGRRGDCIAELRMGGGTKGAQTVFPGSVHESGEAIEWAKDGEPAKSNFAELRTAVTKIAIATILIRRFPAKGSRHDAALALGGFLARAGWEINGIRYFVEIVARLGGSTDAPGRAKDAVDAAESHSRGEKVYGLPGLIEFFGDAPAKKVAKILGYTGDRPEDTAQWEYSDDHIKRSLGLDSSPPDESPPLQDPPPHQTSELPPRSSVKPLATFKHGEVRAEAMRWVVRNRLPETGAGLMIGQWGMYKTFLALDLSAHIMLGWSWTGERIYRQGGVLLLAPEGANSIALRLAALVENKIAKRRDEVTFDPERLPFEWTNSCPPLLGKNPLPTLVATAATAAARFRTEYDLPLSLIWIDTMATAAGWKDENDNAEASRAMAMLRDLSTATGAVVMGIDHLGKNAEAGARGASAKESNSDFVLTATGNKAQDGSVKDTELVLRKLRDGPQGLTIPFTADLVNMGQDEHGELVTSRIINWTVQPRSKYRSENETLLEKVLNEVLAAKGKVVGKIKMARREDVRNAFRDAYKSEKENVAKAAKDERFRKALKSHDKIKSTDIEGVEYLSWLEDEEPF
ncbi:MULTISPECIES: AAA family ATPase [Bradyrhizobium]|uniref:Bifunctional DNA primase/polymerase, N-terminal n=2 Tax=Bradyrhizobium TaxID=374 RepID=A0ABY0PYZ5_9BRAD|nr:MULTISPECIES: AAA family ATPase [Bradyrhizobium]SDJ18121.1 Bifunctional DNA primase/polymerase, N-terminal [Bradyrhizobium ottawaense]SEC84463.1 Bifunctional DNA primase/polymerase, N-terminal [Bradyrhizobium lablabi]